MPLPAFRRAGALVRWCAGALQPASLHPASLHPAPPCTPLQKFVSWLHPGTEFCFLAAKQGF